MGFKRPQVRGKSVVAIRRFFVLATNGKDRGPFCSPLSFFSAIDTKPTIV